MRLVRASALLWGAVHFALLVLGLRRFTLSLHLAVVALVLALAFVDLRANRENVLYADLAIRPRAVVWVVLVVAAGLELAGALAVGALGGMPPMELPF